MTDSAAYRLFHGKTFNTALRNFSFPADFETRHQKIKQWITALEKGTLEEVKEVSLHGSFLNDIFQEVLGYCSIIQGGGKAWEIHSELTISDGGGSADGAIGFFTASEKKQGKVKLQGKVVAPIELKAARIDLDRPTPGRKETPVEQGWRYANYTPECRWIIVSNYRELRLYQTNKTPAYYEKFLLTELAEIEAFKRFYFLLCRNNFLPNQQDKQTISVIDELLIKSNEAKEEITKKLYEEYKAVRLNIVKHFRFTGAKDLPERDSLLIEKAQKTLDRVLFIAFCESRGLLPSKTLSNAHDHKDIYNPRSIWENYKSVFRWVDKGNEHPPIPGYNGGLFQHDEILDEQLSVTDLLCSQLKQLTRFDFETDVSVDILGHIFEQSVTDLEELKAEAAGQEYNQKKGKRKTQGVFYTPAFVTQYIVEVALGGYLNRKEQEIRQHFQLEQIPQRATKKQRETEIKFWETYRDEVLKKTRVIDPACGSGAFLIAAFDYLSRQYERVNEALAVLRGGQRSIFDLNKTMKPYRGILTGFNEAFLIDEATKNKLVLADSKSAEIIKPYLRGQDIKRWTPEWQNLWMIFVGWDCPINNYPSVLYWLEKHKNALSSRPEVKQGRFPWYALSRYASEYWQLFEKPKVIYQVIQTLPQYAFDDSGAYGNDKTFILSNTDLCLLGWLNSPLIWWYSHRIFTKMLSGAISPMGYLFETLPIAPPTDEIRNEVEPIVSRLIEITKANQEAFRDVLDWLKVEYKIDKPGQKLEDFASLDCDEFIAEVKKRKPKTSGGLNPTALKAIREVYNDYAPKIQIRRSEALTLEHRLSDLVNQAYGLTEEEIDLMWRTAPPRMPISRIN